MKRSWLGFVAAAVSVIFGVSSTALAHGGGGHGGGGGFHGGGGGQFSGGQFNSVQRASFNAPAGNHLSGVKVAKPIGGLSPVKPTTPTFPGGPIKPPSGPVVGPIKPPVGPVGPIGPGKPPKGPVVGPVKPPVGPVGPIGPVKPPKGPVVGPVKPPVGPIGPIGPVKPPKGPVVGPVTPPGGGGTGGGTGTGTGGHHHRPPIVLGCLPLIGVGGFGGYYGGYYPPVYTQPIYTQPVVVTTPVAVPVPVAVADASADATTAIAASETPVAPPTATPVNADGKLPQVPVGSTLTLQAKDLGSTGQVLLVMDNLTLGVQVNEWKDDYATATLPLLGITGLTKSEIVLVKADGHAASSVKVELVPAQPNGTEVASAAMTR